jgi:ketosteroid isomerase-like protein
MAMTANETAERSQEEIRMSNPETKPAQPGRPEPADAVRSWWHAMATKDVRGLEALALDDYLAAGGPNGRELGRSALIEGAVTFFADATIDGWQVDAIEVREHGDTAVCSYRWCESGVHAGAQFAIAGIATDVLVLRDGRWRLQAHHVSMSPTASG